VAERTLRLPWTVDFEEEKRESNQPMVRRLEGGVRVQGETGLAVSGSGAE
jgi:hypothetical protein